MEKQAEKSKINKFNGAYFDFKIEPEDSNFIKSWNELKKEEAFQKKINEIKKRRRK